MSTNAYIAIQTDNDNCKVIYSHWDGYLSGVGEMLLNCYSERERVERLIDLGFISSLGEHIDPSTTSHSFFSPEPGVTIAYGRDRGEKNVDPFDESVSGLLETPSKEPGIEYVYIYTLCNKWLYAESGFKEWEMLEDGLNALKEKEEALRKEKNNGNAKA